MTIKKLTFCILCFVNAANLATEEDLNNEKSSISTVEENVLINKNNWNTSKWGDIYFLFPHLSSFNIVCKLTSITKSEDLMIENDSSIAFWGKEKRMPLRYLNFLLSGIVEYKYMFHKYCGINVRLNLNNSEILGDYSLSFLSLETSLEWIYGRKGKSIFSGSFSPFGFAIAQKEDGSRANDFCKECWTLGFVLLKYEYDRRFYLNFGKIKTAWYSLKDINWGDNAYNLLYIEFGLNIIGVNNWRKKRKENIV